MLLNKETKSSKPNWPQNEYKRNQKIDRRWNDLSHSKQMRKTSTEWAPDKERLSTKVDPLGIEQEIKILQYYQTVYAQTIIHPKKMRPISIPAILWHRSPNAGQKTRPSAY